MSMNIRIENIIRMYPSMCMQLQQRADNKYLNASQKNGRSLLTKEGRSRRLKQVIKFHYKFPTLIRQALTYHVFPAL